MKWLATFLCLLTVPALAEVPPNMIQFPSSMLCGAYNNGSQLAEDYGELPFVEGDAQVLSPNPKQGYNGKIRIFIDPNDFSYSILFDINEELSCLLTTGDKLEPIIQGDSL